MYKFEYPYYPVKDLVEILSLTWVSNFLSQNGASEFCCIVCRTKNKENCTVNQSFLILFRIIFEICSFFAYWWIDEIEPEKKHNLFSSSGNQKKFSNLNYRYAYCIFGKRKTFVQDIIRTLKQTRLSVLMSSWLEIFCSLSQRFLLHRNSFTDVRCHVQES